MCKGSTRPWEDLCPPLRGSGTRGREGWDLHLTGVSRISQLAHTRPWSQVRAPTPTDRLRVSSLPVHVPPPAHHRLGLQRGTQQRSL